MFAPFPAAFYMFLFARVVRFGIGFEVRGIML